MSFITQKDFETKAGQEKIIRVIHSLDYKIHELEQKIQELTNKERALQRDIGGYSSAEA